MSSVIVNEKIAAYIDELALEVPAPTGDLGFGSDLSCVDDLTSDMAELDGSDPLLIAQANARRITTPRSSVADDPDYGVDVNEMLSRGITAAALVEIPGKLRAELLKDDRNETVDVAMTTTSGNRFAIAISGTTAAGPFSLTFAVVNGVATLEEINGALNA